MSFYSRVGPKKGKVSDLTVQKLSTDRVLPPKLAIRSAGRHFYSTGLSLYKLRSDDKRPLLLNPYLIFTILFSYVLKIMSTLWMTTKDNDITFVVTGDWIYFCGARYHMLVSAVLYLGLALISQALHFWYNWTGIEPTYLLPFSMLSGEVSPKSIGMSDAQEVTQLIKRSKLFLKIADLLVKSTFPVSLLLSGIPLIVHTPKESAFLLLSMTWVFIFFVTVYLSANFLIYQICYFEIICFYLKIKLKRINANIRAEVESKRNNTKTIINILRSMDQVHCEIREYNDNHWSNYLLLLMLELMTTTNLWLFFIIFTNVNPLMRLVFGYVSLVFASFMIFILCTTAMVSYEATIGASLLNQLFVHKCSTKSNTRLKIKVIIVFVLLVYDNIDPRKVFLDNFAELCTVVNIFNKFLDLHCLMLLKIQISLLNQLFVHNCSTRSNAQFKIKLLTFIEKVGQNRIGFYCGKAFILNNSRVYEIIIITMGYFIKIVEMSYRYMQ